MDPSPKTKKGPLGGLAKLLHLHELPRDDSVSVPPLGSVTIDSLPARAPSREPIPPVNRNSLNPTPIPSSRALPLSPSPARSTSPAFPILSLPRAAPVSTPPPLSFVPLAGATYPSPSFPANEKIITDYDRIYELVKSRQTIKLDEIARLLSLKEERIAQELQTLEDNGLVDVKYPAFGDPLICYKAQEE